MRLAPWQAAIAGAAAGAVIAAALWGTGALDRPRPVDARATFLAAWRTHLLGTWSVDGTDVRTTPGGGRIGISSHTAQRPPNSVTIGLGEIAARRGFVLIACGTPPVGSGPVCRRETTTATWAQSAAYELTTLRDALVHTYAVTRSGPGCWMLTVRPDAPPGPVSRATSEAYCFDLSSGAILSSQVTRPGATDTFSATSHHSPATKADLALPANAVYR